MNPSAEDIASAARKINAENIIILPNNKNIILSAEQSRTLVQRRNIFVLPTKDLPQGIAAVLNYSPDASLSENLENMTAAFSNIDAGQVTYAVRDTVIDNFVIKKGNIIGLDKGSIVTSGKSVEKVTMSLIDRDDVGRQGSCNAVLRQRRQRGGCRSLCSEGAGNPPRHRSYLALRRTAFVLLRFERGVVNFFLQAFCVSFGNSNGDFAVAERYP